MSDDVGKYVITFVLNWKCEALQAGIHLSQNGTVRQIVKTIPGPFDSPEDILGTYIELIDHAEWRGEQLAMPFPAQD